MRIAQVAPLFESVPPHQYGGTERVVSWLTEELVRRGHDVTLVASGDSRTTARLLPAWPEALRLGEPLVDQLAPQLLQVELVRQHEDAWDVIHWHTGQVHLSVARQMTTPHVTTLHGRLDLPELEPLFETFGNAPLVSISDDQRAPLPDANWVATVYHGLPADLLPAGGGSGGYLAFLGRISPEKRVDRAIEIAKRAGMRLKVAAKVDPADEAYYEREIKPLLDDPHIEYVGEIGEDEKAEFLGDAAAMLFPIDWPEPFGLVMIEAMSTGTPTIAYRSGSVPEVLEDGLTGALVSDVDEAVEAVRRLDRFDRGRVRRRFEERFTVERMARDYLEVYERLSGANLVPFPVADQAVTPTAD